MKNYNLEPTEDNIKKALTRNFIGRNEKLVKFAEIILNIGNENVVISLDGNWGVGKTFFVKQFQYLVENVEELEDCKILNNNNKEVFKKLKENNLIAYYNAWENDNQESAIESILFNILNQYPKFKEYLIEPKNQISNVLIDLLKNFIKASSKNIIDLDKLNDSITFVKLCENIEKTEQKKSTLNNLLNEISKDKERIVLIIDDLDRCKPSFAIDILETLKHYYFNNKITTIVVSNNKELVSTLKNYYGAEFDGYGYLNRFYDIIIDIGKVDMKNYLITQQQLLDYEIKDDNFVVYILEYYNFSLRECNRFITMHQILFPYIIGRNGYHDSMFYYLFANIAIALKIKDINQYTKFVNQSGEDIVKTFINELSKRDEEIIDYLKKEIFEKDINIIDYAVKFYLDLFENNNYYYRQFFETLSMLGTNINYNDSKK